MSAVLASKGWRLSGGRTPELQWHPAFTVGHMRFSTPCSQLGAKPHEYREDYSHGAQQYFKGSNATPLCEGRQRSIMTPRQGQQHWQQAREVAKDLDLQSIVSITEALYHISRLSIALFDQICSWRRMRPWRDSCSSTSSPSQPGH